MAGVGDIARILGMPSAGVNGEQFARACELIGTSMKLGEDRIVTTHEVGDWLIDIVATTVRKAEREGLL